MMITRADVFCRFRWLASPTATVVMLAVICLTTNLSLSASEVEVGPYSLTITNDKGGEVRADRNVSMAIKDGWAKIITVVVSREGKSLKQNATEFVAGATFKSKQISKEKIKQTLSDSGGCRQGSLHLPPGTDSQDPHWSRAYLHKE